MWGMPLLTFLSIVCGLFTILVAILWVLFPGKDEVSEGNE